MELIILIVLFGLIFDYTNGFHDAANVVATVIATRALTPLIAVLLGGLFNTIGATQIGGVAQTITTGLVDAQAASQLMVLSAVVGAIIWNLLTWYFGIPSSSSYALVGGLIGAAFVKGGLGIILWKGVIVKVIIPMVLSPFIGFFLAYILMKALYYLLTFFSEKKGEKTFRYMQIFSACLVALSHGLNDAQKSMGIITLGLLSAGYIAMPTIPLWVVFACALTMGIGTASGGFRIIRTVGFHITKIAPAQGFAAELSASAVILTASLFGMPISSTHMIVGAVTGVGAARGSGAVRWQLAHKLVAAWVGTIPASAAISAGAYQMLSYFFA